VRHLVSIGDPSTPAPASFAELPARKLRLEFVEFNGTIALSAGYVRATPVQVCELITFLRGVDTGKVLFHCAAGIGRSPAAACILAALHLGPGREREALLHVQSIKPTVHPNEHMLRLADEALERQGHLPTAAFALWPELYDVLL
jgi:predicted protein tyrosine phosphatase